MLRLDPVTGAAAAGNPLIGSSDANARRIVAHGLRNPFRLTIRPGTNEVWIGDVGWNTWEEINRITNPTAGVTNFGWPCYEGAANQSGYDGANLSLCENLYAAGPTAVTSPVLHLQPLGPGRPRRDLPDRRLLDRRGRLLPERRRARSRPTTTARCSSPTTPATASG